MYNIYKTAETPWSNIVEVETLIMLDNFHVYNLLSVSSHIASVAGSEKFINI